jgi:hypothetical protein
MLYCGQATRTDTFITHHAIVRVCSTIYNELLVKTLRGNHRKSALQAEFNADGTMRNSLLLIVEGTIQKQQGILNVLVQGAVAIG